MSFDNLQQELERRVRGFVQDYHAWAVFVAENYSRHNRSAALDAKFASQYRSIIDTYCAPGKIHQGLVLSNTVDHVPEEVHIVKFEKDGNKAIVFTEVRYTKPPKIGWIHAHEYVFKRLGDNWYLDELYYNDGSNRYPSL